MLTPCTIWSFTADELARIDQFAVDSGIDLWRGPSTE